MTLSTRTWSLRIYFSTDCLAKRRQKTDQMVTLQEAHYCSFFTNKTRLSTDTFLFLIGIKEYNLCQNMSVILNSVNQPCKPWDWITSIPLQSANPVVHSEEIQFCSLVLKCIVLDYPTSCLWEGPKSVSDYIYWTEPTLEQICTFSNGIQSVRQLFSCKAWLQNNLIFLSSVLLCWCCY